MDATLGRDRKKPDKTFADKLRRLAYKHRAIEEAREKKQKLINSEKVINQILDYTEKKAKQGYFGTDFHADLIDFSCGIDWIYIIRKLQSYGLEAQHTSNDNITISWQEQKANT